MEQKARNIMYGHLAISREDLKRGDTWFLVLYRHPIQWLADQYHMRLL